MAMYNLLEFNSNYSDTTGNLWFSSNDEATNFNANSEDNNAFEFLKCKTKLV